MALPKWKSQVIPLTTDVSKDASSNLDSFGYNLPQATLAVKFREPDKKGVPYLYYYRAVDEDTYSKLQDLSTKDEIDQFFIDHIRSKHTKIGTDYYRKK